MSSAKPRKRRGARRLHFAFAALNFSACSPAAWAGSDTDTFDVTATVLATCEVSAQDLTFGNYNPVVASHLDGASQLSVTCTNGTGYEVGLSLGDGAGATTAARSMANGANALQYTLYQDSNRTDLWGDDEGDDTLPGVGTGAVQAIDVFGRIPMQQAAPAGAYEDTIVVTVTW